MPRTTDFFVDDFAVLSDDDWPTEGALLVETAVRTAQEAGHPRVRVVSARRDEPKRNVLLHLGFHVAERWWGEGTPPDHRHRNARSGLGRRHRRHPPQRPTRL